MAGDSLARKDLPAADVPADVPAGVQALGKGIYWSPAPVAGEIGFVFTPAAAAYGGMGRDALGLGRRALPVRDARPSHPGRPARSVVACAP